MMREAGRKKILELAALRLLVAQLQRELAELKGFSGSLTTGTTRGLPIKWPVPRTSPTPVSRSVARPPPERRPTEEEALESFYQLYGKLVAARIRRDEAQHCTSET
ncbi:MAG: hypothetical protein Q8R60_15605 [Mycobacteriales bacterium]|nr:hypothetical protein [Mycobacteriales bacterium]